MKCALCGNGEAIEDSHVVPRFVFRWLKSNGPTGFMRSTEEPNRRRQDGWKQKLLCGDCEDRFSVYETSFANSVFHPLHSGKDASVSFGYGQWLMDFAVSVSWRSLASSLREGGFHKHALADVPRMQLALQKWAQYLLGQEPDIHPFEQHIVLVDEPVSSTRIENSYELGNYMLHGIEFNTMHSPDEVYVFTKFCQVVIVGTIKNSCSGPTWSGTLIEREGTYRGDESKGVSSSFFRFLEHAVERMREARSKITPNQRAPMGRTLARRVEDRKGSSDKTTRRPT